MSKNLTKTEFTDLILSNLSATDLLGSSKRAVDAVLKATAAAAEQAMRRGDSVTVPGIVRLKAVKRPATKAHEGVNPFTKEKMMFPAKPESTKVKASPLKPLKDAVAK